MNPATVGIGVAAILYGLFTLVARAKKPEMFKKLEPMKQRWGPGAGLAIHVVGYTLIPIIFGVMTVVAGLAGKSLF
jgi:hypothetical protein